MCPLKRPVLDVYRDIHRNAVFWQLLTSLLVALHMNLNGCPRCKQNAVFTPGSRLKCPNRYCSFSEAVGTRNRKRNIIPFTRIQNFGKRFISFYFTAWNVQPRCVKKKLLNSLKIIKSYRNYYRISYTKKTMFQKTPFFCRLYRKSYSNFNDFRCFFSLRSTAPFIL